MPSFDENNVRTIEFEAPLSTDGNSAVKKHFSIDLSLELERQLDMESFPPTPANFLDAHAKLNTATKTSPRDSLDPHVLAHIVKQLQQTITDVTKDRDELRDMITLSHSHEAELQDALQHMIDKATTMEIELSDARKKIKDDEEAIALLRVKVEESRRGLMRLQSEKRQSLAPVDVSRAGMPSFGSPPSSKRASFAPLTGTLTARPTQGHGHRRIASLSGSPTNASFSDKTPAPRMHSLSDSLISPISNANTSRRYSGLYGRTSPSPPADDLINAGMEALRKELRSVKDELEQTKHELQESQEAREASETIVKALREIIGAGDVRESENEGSSMASLKLPPPPTAALDDEELESKKTGTTASWGFGKLWGDSTSKASPSIPHSATMAPPSSFPSPQLPMSANPLSRKLGGFFSSRSSSISSITSSRVPPSQANATPSIRESTYSASDTSSVVEPASPQNEYNSHVVVRDVTNFSDSSTGNSPEPGKEIRIHAPSQHHVTT